MRIPNFKQPKYCLAEKDEFRNRTLSKIVYVVTIGIKLIFKIFLFSNNWLRFQTFI